MYNDAAVWLAATISGRRKPSASKQMMDGHKGELFILELSFIGWILLSILTLGIGLLWVNPYMETTIAHYYEELKAEQPAE